RLANALDQEYVGTIIRQAPQATNKLPSMALGTGGGGKITMAAENAKDLLALQKFFLVDLKLEAQQLNIPIGMRAYVRINHGGEPLAKQWYRRIRQVFLRQFNV
ncbi:MAG: hypothetical protein ABL925_05465, partial [Methylococcales bacterium]